jgi:hypothetical protein
MFSRGWETRRVRVVGSAALAATLLALATACADASVDPEMDGRMPSVLEWVDAPAHLAGTPSATVAFEGPRARIEAPATVRAGEPFRVRVVTIGAALCWQPDGAVVEREGMTARITAWDRVPDEMELCALALGELPREVTLTFDSPGTATIRLVGRRVFGPGMERSEPLTLERTVTVLPG